MPASTNRPTGGDAAQQCAMGIAPTAVTAADHDPQALDHGRRFDNAQRAEPTRCRHPAKQHCGNQRLIKLNDDCRARDPLADVRCNVCDAFGERFGDVADGADIGERFVTVVQFEGGRESPRPGDLQLERTDVTLGVFFEDVEVAREQAARPPFVAAVMLGEPPARGLDVDVQTEQVRGAAADHVGADTGPGNS